MVPKKLIHLRISWIRKRFYNHKTMISSSGKRSPLSRGKKYRVRRSDVKIFVIVAIFLILLRSISEQVKKNDTDNVKNEKKDVLVTLETSHGSIKIKLRPDFSKESVEYVTSVMMNQEEKCSPCNFYRSEKGLLLQGIMEKKGVPPVIHKGQCPNEYKEDYLDKEIDLGKCPPSNAEFPFCGCHGPIMTRGLVGWAGGDTGPDFFINVFERPVDWWGNDHTVWGELADSESFAVIETIAKLPLNPVKQNDMNFLKPSLRFDVKIPSP